MRQLSLSETISCSRACRLSRRQTLDSVAARLRHGAPGKSSCWKRAGWAEALAGAEAGFDVIQAEKYSPADIALLVKQFAGLIERPNSPPLEASIAPMRPNIPRLAQISSSHRRPMLRRRATSLSVFRPANIDPFLIIPKLAPKLFSLRQNSAEQAGGALFSTFPDPLCSAYFSP